MKTLAVLFLLVLIFTFGCKEETELPVSKYVKLEFKLAQNYAGDSLEMRVIKKDTIYLYPKVELSNEDIALVSKSEIDNGIVLTFTESGNDKIAKLTMLGFGKLLAVIVDDKVIIAPKIMGKISGKVQILGAFTKEEIGEMFDSLTKKNK
ncbi:MAG: hypothetical protein JXR51_00425 [Bacteroidales bacterium]|nr:hypothetical protein [Bacteroidales bacterium]MBN2755605.1 hypothetical protein [Bacteroidales bacterium]